MGKDLETYSPITRSNDATPVLSYESLVAAHEAMEEANKTAPTHIEVHSMQDVLPYLKGFQKVVAADYSVLNGLPIVPVKKIKAGTAKIVYKDGQESVIKL